MHYSILLAWLVGSVMLVGCSPPDLPYSAAAGAIDARPVSAFGKPYEFFPPEPGESLFDPLKGRSVQAAADALIGAHVAEFAAHHFILGHWAKFHYFYPAATSGPGPGLCRARVYLANGGAADDPGKPSGSWQPDVFAVAGSVAPLPRPWPRGYRERLEAACRARRDMGFWYRAEPDQAYPAARLADAVIAAAGRKGAMPFRLSCRPWPAAATPERARCAEAVRKIVASINPRAIVQVGPCLEKPRPDCLAVAMAKFPERSSSIEEEQWTLNIRRRDEGGLRILSVEVEDTVIIVE